jgi:gamma-glutamyltranspeptidase/glutathione hydrolase
MQVRHLDKAPVRGLFRFLQAVSLRTGLVLVLCCLWLFSAGASAQEAGPGKAAIASAHPQATAAGHQILAAGGNAFDAAVAISAVLAVVEPYNSGLGGGGFWLLHRAGDGFETMVDGRERAPMAAYRDLYLDVTGEVMHGASIDGPLAAGIPGEPAALVHIAKHYGQLPLEQSLAPAIRLANEGFPVDETYRRKAEMRLTALKYSKQATAIFLKKGEVPEPGYQIRQKDLAETLERLAKQGHDGFYRGELANRLVKGVQAAGGIWTPQDLASYQVVERAPIKGRYRDMEITSAAPPSSGGVVLMLMLNILQQYDLAALEPAQRVHLIIEAMRRAYRDRADYLGDPDFVDMPLEQLVHPWYAAGLARDISMHRAGPSLGAEGEGQSGSDTSHFSVIDRDGNRVAATLSINFPFGSGFVPEGTGVLLNDEMDDFSIKAGRPNVYGLVGGEANAIEAGKRMLSSMTPTFVETGRGVAVLGTPGGSRIITMVLLAILDMPQGEGPQAWVTRPRFHHQYLPDQVEFEPGALTDALQQQLAKMGHRLKSVNHSFGNMQAVYWDRKSGEVSAASDPRGMGRAEVR